MTQKKEQALDLVSKFTDSSIKDAIDFALICIEEKIKTAKTIMTYTEPNNFSQKYYLKTLEEVKKEINKL